MNSSNTYFGTPPSESFDYLARELQREGRFGAGGRAGGEGPEGRGGHGFWWVRLVGCGKEGEFGGGGWEGGCG